MKGIFIPDMKKPRCGDCPFSAFNHGHCSVIGCFPYHYISRGITNYCPIEEIDLPENITPPQITEAVEKYTYIKRSWEDAFGGLK